MQKKPFMYGRTDYSFDASDLKLPVRFSYDITGNFLFQLQECRDNVWRHVDECYHERFSEMLTRFTAEDCAHKMHDIHYSDNMTVFK